MRHAAKRDANEPEIIRALELAGWTVIPISDTGVMDLLCIKRGIIKLLEVKSEKGKLTPAQEKTFARIHAAGGTVHVVRTPAEALHAVALGVESELGPRLPMAKLYEDMRAAAKELDTHIPVHPSNIEVLAEVAVDGGLVRLDGTGVLSVVTPAYQKAQTEAVVPKPRLCPWDGEPVMPGQSICDPCSRAVPKEPEKKPKRRAKK